MKILILGEIVGKPGITCIKQLKSYREEHGIDLVIANAEGTTGGFGCGKNHAIQLSKLGVDILTGGEKTFFKKDMVDFIPTQSWILRPANYPPGTPGRGVKTLMVGDTEVVVINLLGMSSFPRVHLGNPFSLAEILIDKIKDENKKQLFIVMFHASTTAEKLSMGFMLDGKVAAVVGTHTKVLSADERILEKGTAYISDNGRCGSQMSVGGLDKEVEVRKFITAIPERSRESWQDLEIQGVELTFDENARAVDITRVRVPVENPRKGK